MADEAQYENYAHKNHPKGPRYVGIKGHTPAWAIDVQDGDGKIYNHLGLEVHVTDEYVHWSEQPVEAKKLMLDMRAIWDRAEADRVMPEMVMVTSRAPSIWFILLPATHCAVCCAIVMSAFPRIAIVRSRKSSRVNVV